MAMRPYGAGYSSTSPVPVRLTPAQREAIEAAARDAGLTLSAYIRDAALVAAGRDDLRDPR